VCVQWHPGLTTRNGSSSADETARFNDDNFRAIVVRRDRGSESRRTGSDYYNVVDHNSPTLVNYQEADDSLFAAICTSSTAEVGVGSSGALTAINGAASSGLLVEAVSGLSVLVRIVGLDAFLNRLDVQSEGG
jgi:hypothetical protein